MSQDHDIEGLDDPLAMAPTLTRWTPGLRWLRPGALVMAAAVLS